jgi:hypothetical protein
MLATGHFEHLCNILRGANFITQNISGGTSVLVHCSDGWDRTSQLSATSLLQLDPYYRTMQGFFVLINKEWLSCGHKFSHRLGHGAIGGRENSPVMTQWLDCVFQLTQQHPAAFEFTADLLLALRHSLFSGRFGSWFGNSEGEREGLVGSGASWKLSEKTPSVWAHLWRHRAHFLNPNYEYAPASGHTFLDANTEFARKNPLYVDLTQLKFWKQYYLPGLDWAPEEVCASRGKISMAHAGVAATPASHAALSEELTALRAQLAQQEQELRLARAELATARAVAGSSGGADLLTPTSSSPSSVNSLPPPPPPDVSLTSFSPTSRNADM